jgi:hypothetical protein
MHKIVLKAQIYAIIMPSSGYPAFAVVAIYKLISGHLRELCCCCGEFGRREEEEEEEKAASAPNTC